MGEGSHSALSRGAFGGGQTRGAFSVPVRVLVGLWLVIGLAALLYGSWGDRASPSAAQHDLVTALPVDNVPNSAPSPPYPVQQPGFIREVKIARDVTGPFDRIVSTREIGGSPTRLGIAFRHQGYRGSDNAEAMVYSRGNFLGGCARQPLNSQASPVYWCQFPSIGAGPGHFQLLVNGVSAGTYNFSVRDADATSALSTVDPNRETAAAARQERRDRTTLRPPVQSADSQRESTVTCILPSGQEAQLSYQGCRQRSGVVY
jgi:hypothetical protein